MSDRNAYFVGARTRQVALALRLAVWDEVSKAFDEMKETHARPQDQQFTIEKLCAEIIESWAAERRILRAERPAFSL